MAVDKKLGLNVQSTGNDMDQDIDEDATFEQNAMRFKNSIKSKQRVMMELKIMHYFIDQQKEKKLPSRESVEYNDTKFLVTALRNLHSSDHCTNCFKKDFECRE